MDEIEDDAIARYPSNPYVISNPNPQGYPYPEHCSRNARNTFFPDVKDDVVDEDRVGGKDDVVNVIDDDDDDVVDEDRLGGKHDVTKVDDDVVDEDRLGGKYDVVNVVDVDDDDDDDDIDKHRIVQLSLEQVDEDYDMNGDDDENDDNDQQSEEYGYLKHHVRNSPYSQPLANEGDNDEDEEDEEKLRGEDDGDDGDDVDQNNNVLLSLKRTYEEDENDDDNNDDDDDDGGDNDDDDNDNKQKSYTMKIEDELEWHPRKQKLKSLISTYEFAARVPTPSDAAPSGPKPSFGVRNPFNEWTERETFVLLDAWGDRFLQSGRKSLRLEEWQQVAEKVSEVSKIERTDTQCRNRLDTLKKKYKKDKIKFSEMGGGDRKWVYFKKMDKLMSSPSQQAGISSGLDSGECVFTKPKVYVNRAIGLDDMKDSPENTESIGEERLEGPRTKKRRKGRDNGKAYSFNLLANSIQRFGKIYEKIENSYRKQMMELEKMRMEFLNDLETQKRQIFERLQSEISKLEQRDDENDEFGM